MSRIEILKGFLKENAADSFSRYALALEYVKLGQNDDAVREFETVTKNDPGYARPRIARPPTPTPGSVALHLAGFRGHSAGPSRFPDEFGRPQNPAACPGQGDEPS